MNETDAMQEEGTPMWRRWADSHPVTAFFLLTYLFSWSVWWLVMPLAADAGWGLRTAVHTVGLCGPTVAALLMSGLLHGRKGIGELLKRITYWRVGIGWYLFALFSTLGIGYAAIGVHSLFGGVTPPLSLPLVYAQALAAGLPEEYGWRGFALPYLLKKNGALASSLVIAFFWVLWHLPISPALRNPMVLGLFLLEVVPLTILFTWLYINTGGSILLAVLYHLVTNAVVSVLNIPEVPSLWAIYVCMLWLTALLVVVRFGGPRLNSLSKWRSPGALGEPAP
jgi:membrane protease YdiL (CAAX protease family)